MDPTRELGSYNPGASYDKAMDFSINYRPEGKAIKDHAAMWAESKGHDDQTIRAYATWYSDTYEGHRWAEMPSHASAFDAFGAWVEQQTWGLHHPARVAQREALERVGLLDVTKEPPRRELSILKDRGL